MSIESDNPSKQAFSTRCVPGSAAEKQETERLAEFQRCKALRKAQEAQDKPGEVEQRHQVYLAGCEENKERMRLKRQSYSSYVKRSSD